MFVSLIRLGKQDVLETAHAFNLETLQSEPAEAASHQAEQAAVLVPLLGLCEQQQELIAVGMRLYYDLVLEIYTERRALQVKVAAAAATRASASGTTMPSQRSTNGEANGSNAQVSNAAACSSEGGGSGSSSAEGIAAGVISRLESLEKQCEVTDRLQLLLHKVWCSSSHSACVAVVQLMVCTPVVVHVLLWCSRSCVRHTTGLVGSGDVRWTCSMQWHKTHHCAGC
jgi:hypothetical protein